MIRTLRCTALLLSVLALSAPASATLITFNPSASTVEFGQQASVDVVISPVNGELIGAFDITVNWDDAILSLASVTFGTSLVNPIFPLQQIIGGSSGSVQLRETSASFDLASLQDGTPFTLFSIVFDTVGLGTSGLSMSNVIVGGDLGFPLLSPPEPQSGSVTVVERPVQVPEPSTWLLMLTGIVFLFRRKFRTEI